MQEQPQAHITLNVHPRKKERRKGREERRNMGTKTPTQDQNNQNQKRPRDSMGTNATVEFERLQGKHTTKGPKSYKTPMHDLYGQHANQKGPL